MPDPVVGVFRFAGSRPLRCHRTRTIDIAKSVGELQSRLTWELTLESLNRRVAEWTVAARACASSEDRPALDTLAEQNELRLEVHERLKCGPATPGSAAHAAALALRERGVSLPE